MTAMLSADEREEMRHGVIAQRREWLDEILTPYRARGLECEVKVLWHNRPFECVIQEVLEQRHDLVVKATHKHSFLQTFIFTPPTGTCCANALSGSAGKRRALAAGAT